VNFGTVTPVTCRRCGELLNANANFCWACGAPQHESSSPETVAVPVVSANEKLDPDATSEPELRQQDTLIIAAGALAGSRFELVNEVVTVGRHEASDVLLDDVSVSRHHCLFTRTASGRYTVRDLNSLNGTYVNGKRVEEMSLHSSDEVQVGKFKLIFWGATS
jgi:pSer/pThr/pTyr-binding forkhead associated (FHA) protein